MTDRRPGKTICLPTLKGGDIINKIKHFYFLPKHTCQDKQDCQVIAADCELWLEYRIQGVSNSYVEVSLKNKKKRNTVLQPKQVFISNRL